MTARPMTIRRYGPAFETGTAETIAPAPPAAPTRADARGPMIEMTAHPDDGGHYWGWYPATPEGLICAGGAFARLRGYGYRHPPVCRIAGTVIPQGEIETAVVVPFSRTEALRRAAALLRIYGVAV